MIYYYANNPGWAWYVYTWTGTRAGFECFLRIRYKSREVSERCVRNLLSKTDLDHLHQVGWRQFSPRGMTNDNRQ